MRAFALLLLLSCSGCILVHTERNTTRVLPPPPCTPEDIVTLQEIDAAAGLAFESSRANALSTISARAGLSPAAQVHLVRSAYGALAFDDSRLQVLLKVIDNPAFCLSAKQEILTHLPELRFDASRVRVLEQLDKRAGA